MNLDFEKMNGLIPAIIQDNYTQKVLMLGFMNEEAYRYFDGEITASQAAEYVQNRVSLYLAEQG